MTLSEARSYITKQMQEERDRYSRATNEIRRLAHEGVIEHLTFSELVNEVKYRARVDETTAKLSVGHLEDYQEIIHHFASLEQMFEVGPALKAADPEFLSDFTWSHVPVGNETHQTVPYQVRTAYPASRSPLNKERAMRTHAVIEEALAAGSTILIRNANGDIEELPFTNQV